MRGSLFFTLGILLAWPARDAVAVQNEPAPDQNEPASAQIGASESDIDSADPECDSDDCGEDPAGPDPDAEADPADPRERAGPDHTGDEDEEEPAPGDRKDGDDGLELEVTTTAGTRGEGAADALVRLARGRFTAALGVGDGGSTESAQRQWLRAQLGAKVGLALSAAALWEPAQAGATQEQLKLGAAGESERSSWELELTQESVQLSASAAGLSAKSMGLALSGGSLSLDGARLVWEESGLHATAHAGAGMYSLTLPRSAALPWSALQPWDRLGERALAWPARAEGALGLSLEGDLGSASAALGAGLPAQTGSLEGELTLSGERKLGRATLSLQLSAAHLWPSDLWQGALTFCARWRFASG